MELTIFSSEVIIKCFSYGLNNNELLAIYARTYKTMYSKNKNRDYLLFLVDKLLLPSESESECFQITAKMTVGKTYYKLHFNHFFPWKIKIQILLLIYVVKNDFHSVQS